MNQQNNNNRGDRQGQSRDGGGGNRHRHKNRHGGHNRRFNKKRRNPQQQHQQQQTSNLDSENNPLDPMKAIKIGKNPFEPNRQPSGKKKFDVVFFETVPQALAAKETIAQKSKETELLNIVIKAEGDRNIPELTQYGKVFAGEAWTIIHQRRVADGWYTEPHEIFENN